MNAGKKTDIPCLDLFGLDFQNSWRLLMDDSRWAEWKQQCEFM